MSNNVYAIYNSSGSVVVFGHSNKTDAWDEFLEHKGDLFCSWERESTIARYRRNGYYCDTYHGAAKRKDTTVKPQPKADKKVYIKYNGHEVELTFGVMANIEEFYNAKTDNDSIDVYFDIFLKAVKLAVLADGDDL